mgnify:CR=1 FL=1
MSRIEQVTIVGVGLIGGSLGLVFRHHGIRVVGFDISRSGLDRAIQRGVIDRGETDLTKAAADADVIILCTPVRTIRTVLEQLATMTLKRGTIVTDTGSTKSELVSLAEKLQWQNDATYIGGHPMAGSHRSGVEAASMDLFENAYYVLTPTVDLSPGAVEKLTDLLELTRAKVILMNPVEHDRIMAAISHWPHVLAALLVHQVGKYNEEDELYHHLAAGGFRDLTRIASSNPKMWSDITLTNREMVLTMLDDWQKEVERFYRTLHNAQPDELEAFFQEAKQYRDQLPQRKQGSLPRFYECYIDVPDHPGIIGKVATLLGNEEINLANIGILENREEVAGVLRLTFNRKADFTHAVSVLKANHYTVYQPDKENGNRWNQL